MIILYCSMLFWIMASLHGYGEAITVYYRNNAGNLRNSGYNEHIMYVIQRSFEMFPIAYLMFNKDNLFTLLNGLFLSMTFIVFHDGFYYMKRNKLDGSYPLGFWDQSHTSTSWWDKKGLTNPILRVTYFAIGMVGLIIINYAKY